MNYEVIAGTKDKNGGSYRSMNLDSNDSKNGGKVQDQPARRIGYNAGRPERWVMKLYNKFFK